MNKNFNLNTKNNDTWLTPPIFVNELGHFDLDPCVPIEGMPASMYPNGYPIKQTFNINDDGLKQDWLNKRIWCNPPYGKETFRFVEKAIKDKCTGYFLIFARTETVGFQSLVFNSGHFDSICFLKGRVKFHYIDGSTDQPSNAPSCLVTMSKCDTEILSNKLQQGVFTGKLLSIFHKKI